MIEDHYFSKLDVVFVCICCIFAKANTHPKESTDFPTFAKFYLILKCMAGNVIFEITFLKLFLLTACRQVEKFICFSFDSL